MIGGDALGLHTNRAVSLATRSHRAKAKAKMKKIEVQAKQIKEKIKHQIKFSTLAFAFAQCEWAPGANDAHHIRASEEYPTRTDRHSHGILVP